MADWKGLNLLYLFVVSLILAVLDHGMKVAKWIRLHHRERGGWEGTHHLANWVQACLGNWNVFSALMGMHKYVYECF